MTTRINTDGPSPSLTVSASALRVTPPPARPFSSLLDSGANAVLEGAEAAAQRLPGGPALVAAVRDGQAGPAYAPGQSYPSQSLYGPSGSASPTEATGASGSVGSTAGSGHIESALARQTQDNLYYLGLQQRIQDETRHFQAVSNVLKTQHDSVKNAIGNLR